MSKHTSIRAVKQITVYITSLANHNPSLRGYTVSLSDPDAGHTGARTFSSGYAVPCPVYVPQDWTVGESGTGEEFLYDLAGRPWELGWERFKGVMIATVAGHSSKAQIKNGEAVFLKSLSREALGV